MSTIRLIATRPTFAHRAITIVLLLAMAITIIAQRVRLSDAPLHGDICAYSMIGHEMLKGRKLYSDLWERKPPLLYITYAASELIVGYGRREIIFLSITTAILTMLGLYLAGHAAGAGRIGGLLAAGLWTILCSDLELAANQPDPEVFINLLLVAALALIVLPMKMRPLFRGIAIGALLAAVTLYKHNTALVCAALIGANALFARPRRFVESIIAIAMIALAWAGLLGYFAAVGRLHDFIEVVFNQNFAYSGSISDNLASSLQPGRFFPAFMIWAAGPFAIVVLFIAIAATGNFRSLILRSEWFTWLSYAIGTWATVALTGYIYPHYFQLWLPVWCIAVGWAGAALICRDFPIPRLLRAGLVGAMFLILIFRQAAQFEFTPEQWVQRQFPYVNFAELQQVEIELDRLLKPSENFWELGEDNALYFDTQHSPPVGLLYIDPLIYGKEQPAYWQRLMSDLHRTRPDLVLLSAGWNKFFHPSDPVFPWILQNYDRYFAANVPQGYQIWLRRGSDVQHRCTK